MLSKKNLITYKDKDFEKKEWENGIWSLGAFRKVTENAMTNETDK